ncbi:hypothetical protein HBE96_09125 [Clostridium sp. P21]|uniref:Uncharacterized protein n=1 Tax=Clostridium muellerianum TaxID=2716538 RepID=A0A7Y0EG53_9CLOT|nr:hypothetical protein [Clostridium muellerianum]NMM62859.1 hypothetical protein [Clostridium muellerianum]
MLGLKKCSEEDFHQFIYSNSKYHPRNTDGKLIGNLIAILIFSGLGWFYIEQSHINCPYLISIIIKIIIIGDIGLFIFSRINKKKYAFKFQKFFIIIIAINWFVFSLLAYPMPLIVFYCHNNVLFKIVIYTIILVCIYSIFVFIRLIILIRKGEMGKDCVGLNERLFGKKIRYLGFSIPVIVIASKLGRRATIDMQNRGINMGPPILVFVLAFIIQVALVSIIPECIIVVYCKSRFESFNFSYESYLNRGKKGKKPMRQKNK